VGIVVHIGAADYGHYYSYIDSRREKEDLLGQEESQEAWFEFNDSHISSFST